MKKLVNFLTFCINNEKNGRINSLNNQKNFNKFLELYSKNNFRLYDDKYKNVLDSIEEAHNVIINKTDESAMDYKESNYNTAKALTLTNTKPGYNLTDDEPTKLNSAAFITTAIILQATLILSLIFTLLALVK